MIVLQHLREQLRPRVLSAHWTALNVKLPVPQGRYLPVMLALLLLWAAFMLLRIGLFVVLVVVLAVGVFFQWRVPAAGESCDIGDDNAVLLLRPFGADGKMTLFPHVLTARDRWYPRTALIESIVAKAARKAEFTPVAVRDGARRVVPCGPGFLLLPDDHWKPVVRSLANAARWVVVLAPPTAFGGPGLDWELELLRTDGLAHKVILIAPPAHDHAATNVMERAIRSLGWGRSEYARDALVAFLGTDGSLVTAGYREHTTAPINLSQQQIYVEALDMALNQ